MPLEPIMGRVILYALKVFEDKLGVKDVSFRDLFTKIIVPLKERGFKTYEYEVDEDGNIKSSSFIEEMLFLEDNGLVKIREKRVSLTEAGRKMACEEMIPRDLVSLINSLVK